jgi:ABC-2 type transport system permease protein
VTAFLAIFTVTLRQLLGGRRFIALTLVALVPALMMVVGSNDLEELVMIASPMMMTLLLPLLAIMISGGALGDEKRDQTMSFLVLRPISRLTIAGAKVLAAVVGSGVFALLSSVSLGITYSALGGELAVIAPLVAGALTTTTAYAATFVLVGLLISRSTLVGLAFVFLWEGALVSNFAGMAKLSLWRIGAEMMDAFSPEELKLPDEMFGILERSAQAAGIRLALVAITSVLLTGWVLRRRDNI